MNPLRESQGKKCLIISIRGLNRLNKVRHKLKKKSFSDQLHYLQKRYPNRTMLESFWSEQNINLFLLAAQKFWLYKVQNTPADRHSMVYVFVEADVAEVFTWFKEFQYHKDY